MQSIRGSFGIGYDVFKFAIVYCGVLSVIAAMASMKLDNTVLKYGGFLIAGMAFFLEALGQYFYPPREKNAEYRSRFFVGIMALLPYVLLGGFSFLGSLYARLFLDIRETYLILSLSTVIPIASYWMAEKTNPEEIFKFFKFYALGFAAVLALTQFTKPFDDAFAPMHEREFIYIPAMLFLVGQLKKKWNRYFFSALLILGLVLTKKLTPWLVLSVCLVFNFPILLSRFMGMKDALKKWLLVFVSAVCIGSCAAVYVFVVKPSGNLVATGNKDVRLHQYDAVYEKIKRSPVYGALYTDSSGEWYVENGRARLIPTHSDMLDLAKQGGVLAVLLWFSPLLFVFYQFFKKKLYRFDSRENQNIRFLCAVVISFNVVAAVNPLVLQPTLAFFYWLAIGMLVSLVNRPVRKDHHEVIA